jgi:hypothetical protein
VNAGIAGFGPAIWRLDSITVMRTESFAGWIPRLHLQGQETPRTQTDAGARTHKPITRTDPSEPEEATVIPATLSKPKHAAFREGDDPLAQLMRISFLLTNSSAP